MLEYLEINRRRYARFPRLARVAGLVHAFSTRPNDVSARTDPKSAARAARRGQMASDLGLDPAHLCHCIQVHETRCALIDDQSPLGPYEGFDALITHRVGVPLMTFSADCPLILVFDPVQRVVGMVHSSWRCTVAGATRLLVEQMQAAAGCRPTDLQAGIGPGAGPCCYEVQDDVYSAAERLPDRDSFFIRREEGLFFDLWSANQAQLLAAGLPAQAIERADTCTLCQNDVFYSFRREGVGCGHFGLMAARVE